MSVAYITCSAHRRFIFLSSRKMMMTFRFRAITVITGRCPVDKDIPLPVCAPWSEAHETQSTLTMEWRELGKLVHVNGPNNMDIGTNNTATETMSWDQCYCYELVDSMLT